MSDQGTIEQRVASLREQGVRRIVAHWADNNGIVRARVIPIDALLSVARRGVGSSLLLAVFDSHDRVAQGAPGISTASGDRRLVPDLASAQLAGLGSDVAYVAVDQFHADGSVSEYDPRAALRRQLAQAADGGIEFLVGTELEFTLLRTVDGDSTVPAHTGPAYSPGALLALGSFPADLLSAFEGAGIDVGQIHAEYGDGQVEASFAATDPLTAADNQLVARAIVREVSAAHGLRASFAPLTATDRAGNGAHVHISVWRDGVNLLAPRGDRADVHGLGRDGAHALAGLLRDLAALSSVGAPGAVSLIRLRPGSFAGSYVFWGVENRDAPLRVAEGGALLGADYWNVEFRSPDASGNPHLVLAALVAAALAGLNDELELPEPYVDNPHTWTEDVRARRGVVALPSTPAEQEAAIDTSTGVRGIFTPEHRDAFRAVRRSDAEWAATRQDEEIITRHLWLY